MYATSSLSILNMETEDNRELREEDEEEKVPRNSATLYICTVPRVAVNQPRDRSIVVYLITLTG